LQSHWLDFGGCAKLVRANFPNDGQTRAQKSCDNLFALRRCRSSDNDGGLNMLEARRRHKSMMQAGASNRQAKDLHSRI